MTTDSTPPRRRFLDQPGGPPSLLGDGGRVDGVLTIPGPLAIGGTVHANGSVGGVLTIGRTGRWHGNVHAHAAVILGELHGELIVDTTLELGRTAVIHGSVRAALVAIADGAIVNGRIDVTGETPPVHFTDRRRDPPDDGSDTG
jgi:cytoskeletal protein CcmA (bactofilin family)